MTMPCDLPDVSARIDWLLDLPVAIDLVAAYFNETLTFAGTLFDSLGDNPANAVTTDDLLAVSLLDVGFKPRAVRALLDTESGALHEALASIPTDLSLWETDDDLLNGSAHALWNLLDRLDGIGGVKASKLMARKRPRLIPIVDSVVIATIGTSWRECWRDIRTALIDSRRRERLETLRPDVSLEVTTLRLLDVLVWMYGSESTSARNVRRDLGLYVNPR